MCSRGIAASLTYSATGSPPTGATLDPACRGCARRVRLGVATRRFRELARAGSRCDALAAKMSFGSYEEALSVHRWVVPPRYNIAADVCDKHPRDKPAMVWESFDGSYRELVWGELQDLANQAAHTLAAQGVSRGDRVAVVLPPTPETAAIFFGVWKLGAILLSM